MNRTADFWDQVRSIKRKQSLPMETREETRPTLSISPFLRDALKLDKRIQMACRYTTEFSKQWKSNKLKLSEASESEFESFEEEMTTLIKTIENEIDSFSATKYEILQSFSVEVQKDLKEHFMEFKSLYQSVVKSHSSYQRFSSILKPTLSSSMRMKDIIKEPVKQSKREYDNLLNSISVEERDRLLSENVLLEKSLERELDAIKQMEKNTTELTQLISVFNQHIAEQHEMVDAVHDNTQTAKEHVDEGYKELLKAEENNKGTQLKLAYFIFFLTFLLLVYNWLK